MSLAKSREMGNSLLFFAYQDYTTENICMAGLHVALQDNTEICCCCFHLLYSGKAHFHIIHLTNPILNCYLNWISSS